MGWKKREQIFMNAITIKVGVQANPDTGEFDCYGVAKGVAVFYYKTGSKDKILAEFRAIVKAIKYAYDKKITAYITTSNAVAKNWIDDMLSGNKSNTMSELGNSIIGEKAKRVQIRLITKK